MNKSIQIIYEDFEIVTSGINRNLKSATIQFCEKTTEYIPSLNYADNFEAMVSDIIQNGYVYLNDNNVISVLNIKKFIGNNNVPFNDSSKPFNDSSKDKNAHNLQPVQKNQQRRWRKNERRNAKKFVPQAFSVKPEEILNKNQDQIKNATEPAI
jgi:hypothetical protein